MRKRVSNWLARSPRRSVNPQQRPGFLSKTHRAVYLSCERPFSFHIRSSDGRPELDFLAVQTCSPGTIRGAVARRGADASRRFDGNQGQDLVRICPLSGVTSERSIIVGLGVLAFGIQTAPAFAPSGSRSFQNKSNFGSDSSIGTMEAM